MKHFVNTLFREANNSINYIIRKDKTKRFLYESDSMSMLVDDKHTLGETIKDDGYFTNPIVKSENDLEVNLLFNKIDDTENKAIEIRYDNVSKCNFSYRNLMKLYDALGAGKKLVPKDFKGLIYNAKTGIALNEKEISPLLSDFKNYLRQNKVFGGIA